LSTTSQSLMLHVWHNGQMVDVALRYFDGTGFRDIHLHRWNGTQFT
jgi:hypothetical protein